MNIYVKERIGDYEREISVSGADQQEIIFLYQLIPAVLDKLGITKAKEDGDDEAD